jgi:hypothetical protein
MPVCSAKNNGKSKAYGDVSTRVTLAVEMERKDCLQNHVHENAGPK